MSEENRSQNEARVATVLANLQLLIGQTDVTELRALNVVEKGVTFAGHYTYQTLERMAAEAVALEELSTGVYFTLNPLKSHLLVNHRHEAGRASRNELAKDDDVLRRVLLLIDADPVRPANVSATREEKGRAAEKVMAVYEFLQSQGWPVPVVADSGNGSHLLCRISLPAVDGMLVRKILQALAQRFTDRWVTIDESVFNASRISKLYGTCARKGEPSPERPHRRSRIIDSGSAEIVPTELLEELAAEVRPAKAVAVVNPAKPTPAKKTSAATGTDKASVIARAREYLVTLPPAIQGANGSKPTFHAACALICGYALSREDAEPLLTEYSQRCIPPWSDKELAHKLDDAETKAREDPDHVGYLLGGKRGGKNDEEQRKSPVERIIDLADMVGAELFRTPGAREAYARIAEGEHYETLAITSEAFSDWLTHQHLLVYGNKAPSSQALKDAVATLRARARFLGEEHPVYTRVAMHDEKVYVDLGDKDWKAVAVTADGWELTNNPPVRFRRPDGLLALPAPVRGGRIDELFEFVNIKNDADKKLLLGWLLGTLWPKGPFPVLILTGEQGCAKSTAADFVRSLIDPNYAALRDLPRNGDDLMIASTDEWVVAFDNLSGLPTWISDALCRLSTGGGAAKRKLYADSSLVFFQCRRPVILVGIDELANRGDLLDRAIIITLPVIPDEQRQPEDDIRAEFIRAQPRILGAILDVVSGALRNLPSIDRRGLPRMADFARWIMAAESELGWEAGSFRTAYDANIHKANAVALEADIVVPFLQQLVEHGDWPTSKEEVRTPTDLLNAINGLAGGAGTMRNRHGWPQRACELMRTLNRLAPGLRRFGIVLDSDRLSGGKRTRWVRLRRLPTADEDSTK